MSKDLDEAIDSFARAAMMSGDGTSHNVALGLKALAKHLRNATPPATDEGKAEQGEGPSDEEYESGRTLYEAWRHGNDPHWEDVPPSRQDDWARCSLRAKQVLAGQHSAQLSERERAVVEAAKRWAENPSGSDDDGWSWTTKLIAAVDALGEGRE